MLAFLPTQPSYYWHSKHIHTYKHIIIIIIIIIIKVVLYSAVHLPVSPRFTMHIF